MALESRGINKEGGCVMTRSEFNNIVEMIVISNSADSCKYARLLRERISEVRDIEPLISNSAFESHIKQEALSIINELINSESVDSLWSLSLLNRLKTKLCFLWGIDM